GWCALSRADQELSRRKVARGEATYEERRGVTYALIVPSANDFSERDAIRAEILSSEEEIKTQNMTGYVPPVALLRLFLKATTSDAFTQHFPQPDRLGSASLEDIYSDSARSEL